MKAPLILFLFQTVFICKGTTVDISSVVPLCSPSDSSCIKASGEKFMEEVGKGIPEWNLDSVDPFHMDKATFTEDNKETKLTITYTDIIQTGISKLKILEASINPDKGTMFFKLKYPIYTFEADFEANGVIFDFHVSGGGKANITVWDSIMEVSIKFHIEDDHIKQDSVEVNQIFEKIYLNYQGLKINDDKELSESAGTFINENAAMILNGFKPELQKFYSGIIKEHLGHLFDNVPYSSLFKL